jgi:hypothetical protein
MPILNVRILAAATDIDNLIYFIVYTISCLTQIHQMVKKKTSLACRLIYPSKEDGKMILMPDIPDNKKLVILERKTNMESIIMGLIGESTP